MKAITSSIFILILAQITYGQNIAFKDFNFNDGGYSILGIFSESDKSALQDSLGEFYTDEISILNQFKSEWIFNKPGKKYACGYHYKIFVCKDGVILKSFGVNLNCKEIVSEEGYFQFDPNKIRVFYGKLKHPIEKTNKFNSIVEARKFRKNILNDSNLIMSSNPGWSEFEGTFTFTYKCKENTKDCIDEDQKIFNSIEAEIKNKYPNENFELLEVGGSWTAIELMIICNKSLSTRFSLKNCERDPITDKWEPYLLTLTSYWKTRK